MKDEEELSKDELKTQIEWIQKIMKVIVFLATFTLVRIFVRRLYK